jgi:hypothetical protein
MADIRSPLGEEKVSGDILKYVLDLISETLNSSNQAINQTSLQIKELIQAVTSSPTRQELIDKLAVLINTHDNKTDNRFKEVIGTERYSADHKEIINKLIEMYESIKRTEGFYNSFERSVTEKLKKIEEDNIATHKYISELEEDSISLIKELVEKAMRDQDKLINKFDKFMWGIGILLTGITACWGIITWIIEKNVVN